MPFGIHPEDSGDIKTPWRMWDYWDYSRETPDFSRTETHEDRRRAILQILRRKRLDDEDKECITILLNRSIIDEQTKTQIGDILSLENIYTEQKLTLKNIIKSI